MQSFRLLFSAVLVLFAVGAAHADTRPDSGQKTPFPKRSSEETIRLLQLGQHLRCSLSQSFVLQTKERGYGTPDNAQYEKKVLFNSLAPEGTSASEFGFYSLSWENEDFEFYFSINFQLGKIEISDKRNGMSAETFLDLSDFAKEEVFVGTVDLVQKEDLLVTNPQNPKEKIPGLRRTHLTASCQFLDNYVP